MSVQLSRSTLQLYGCLERAPLNTFSPFSLVWLAGMPILRWLGCERRRDADEEVAEETAEKWARLVPRLQRLAFKRRCWSALGQHLRQIRLRGNTEVPELRVRS